MNSPKVVVPRHQNLRRLSRDPRWPTKDASYNKTVGAAYVADTTAETIKASSDLKSDLAVFPQIEGG